MRTNRQAAPTPMKSTSRNLRRPNNCPSLSNFAVAALPLPATILQPPLEIPMLAQHPPLHDPI